VCHAKLLIVLGRGSHQLTRPAETSPILKATLGDLRLERAAEDGRHCRPYAKRVEPSRRQTGVGEMRDRRAQFRVTEAPFAPHAQQRLAFCRSSRRYRYRAQSGEGPVRVLKVQ